MPLANPPMMDRFKEFRKFPLLRTKRLNLRELTIEDAEWFLRHFSTPEIVKGDGSEGPDGFEGAERELRQYCIDLFSRREGFRWGLELRTEPRLVGSAGFYKWFAHTPHKAELGYDLDPDYWGQGLMTEALTAVIGFGFLRMKLRRIQVIIAPHNKNSLRLARRLGFKKEGLLRENSLDEHGRPEDDLLYSLLKREWQPEGRKGKIRRNS